MKYTAPDYYREFRCIGSACPATCCAGWKIVIDGETLKKYRARRDPLGNRLANSICWKEKTFLQYSGRCAFLDENNLCDIYTEAGPDMLCRTCRNYPRHIEEFENEREISLSLSCPVVARMVLGRKQKVCFRSRETSREEETEDFDSFLYSALQDCRTAMFELLQNRERSISFRIAGVLAMAHDVQNRIGGRRIFEVEALLDRYRRPGAAEKLAGRFAAVSLPEHPEEKLSAMMGLLKHLETLAPDWPERLDFYRKVLYEVPDDGFLPGRQRALRSWGWDEKRQKWTGDDWPDTEMEQLMVYFLFTYLCGAVYDGDLLSKVKMAVVSTLLIREMEFACQMERLEPITLEDRAQIAWQYSRELEHSDPNLNRMEGLMRRDAAAGFETLLGVVLRCAGPLRKQ